MNGFFFQFFLLNMTYFQGIEEVQPRKRSGVVIHVVAALPRLKIYHFDEIHLLNIGMRLTNFKVIGNGFGGTKKHSMKIVLFAVILQLNQHKFPMLIFAKYVHLV